MLHRIIKERENGIFFSSNFSWKMERVENKREKEREREKIFERKVMKCEIDSKKREISIIYVCVGVNCSENTKSTFQSGSGFKNWFSVHEREEDMIEADQMRNNWEENYLSVYCVGSFNVSRYRRMYQQGVQSVT